MDNYDEIYKFSSIILERVKKNNLEYLDAIVSYCEENDLEIESIVDLISPSLKSYLENEAISLHLIKNTTMRFQL